MDNRRQDYRFLFALRDRRPVECIVPAGRFQAEMVDLSTGGMRLRVAHCPFALAPGEHVVVSFSLGNGPLTVPARVIHDGVVGLTEIGVHFLPVLDGDERERVIWTFLLAEQRQHRRLQLAGREAARRETA